MANFATHISVAAVGAGLFATAALKLGQVDEPGAVVLTLLGTLGGILPDIDLKYSYPSRIIFSVFGMMAAFASVFALREQFSIIELWMTATLVFLLVRYPLWAIFHKFAEHRGAIHSVAMALLVWLGCTSLAFHAFGQSPGMAWLSGSFAGGGFLLHLLLDELYSVDFMNNSLKRSFGSAMKLIDTGALIPSACIVLLAGLFWLTTPPADALLWFGTSEFSDALKNVLLPQGGWFGTQVQ
ncbi:metal-dependent hydrolase [Granulosicoccaceae sp. 1_MG-2023]|nr:metal-dependent hydrolase [Granulosicoccaceae sp. 1_MG-2023]